MIRSTEAACTILPSTSPSSRMKKRGAALATATRATKKAKTICVEKIEMKHVNAAERRNIQIERTVNFIAMADFVDETKSAGERRLQSSRPRFLYTKRLSVDFTSRTRRTVPHFPEPRFLSRQPQQNETREGFLFCSWRYNCCANTSLPDYLTRIIAPQTFFLY